MQIVMDTASDAPAMDAAFLKRLNIVGEFVNKHKIHSKLNWNSLSEIKPTGFSS